MKRFLHFLFFLILTKVSFAQKLSSLIADGKTAIENKEYYLAENYFKKAIGIDSTNMELQYLYAEACRLDLNYSVAERWYNKVYKKDNGKVYPDSLYHLAACKKSNGRYKDAIKMFDKYSPFLFNPPLNKFHFLFSNRLWSFFTFYPFAFLSPSERFIRAGILFLKTSQEKSFPFYFIRPETITVVSFCRSCFYYSPIVINLELAVGMTELESLPV